MPKIPLYQKQVNPAQFEGVQLDPTPSVELAGSKEVENSMRLAEIFDLGEEFVLKTQELKESSDKHSQTLMHDDFKRYTLEQKTALMEKGFNEQEIYDHITKDSFAGDYFTKWQSNNNIWVTQDIKRAWEVELNEFKNDELINLNKFQQEKMISQSIKAADVLRIEGNFEEADAIIDKLPISQRQKDAYKSQGKHDYYYNLGQQLATEGNTLVFAELNNEFMSDPNLSFSSKMSLQKHFNSFKKNYFSNVVSPQTQHIKEELKKDNPSLDATYIRENISDPILADHYVKILENKNEAFSANKQMTMDQQFFYTETIINKKGQKEKTFNSIKGINTEGKEIDIDVPYGGNFADFMAKRQAQILMGINPDTNTPFKLENQNRIFQTHLKLLTATNQQGVPFLTNDDIDKITTPLMDNVMGNDQRNAIFLGLEERYIYKDGEMVLEKNENAKMRTKEDGEPFEIERIEPSNAYDEVSRQAIQMYIDSFRQVEKLPILDQINLFSKGLDILHKGLEEIKEGGKTPLGEVIIKEGKDGKPQYFHYEDEIMKLVKNSLEGVNVKVADYYLNRYEKRMQLSSEISDDIIIKEGMEKENTPLRNIDRVILRRKGKL